MSSAPSLGIPELAGICTYQEAARIGYSVEENVRRLLRYHWTERRLMEISVARLTATPEWEVKCALALHQWQDAEHADAIRGRIAEMRSPAPRMDAPPDPALDAFLEEALRAADSVELLAGLYGVARPALATAYREHLAATNPLVDHPTRRLLRTALAEEEEAIAWGVRALEALIAREGAAAAARSAAWEAHLRAYLDAAGGIAGVPPRHHDDTAAPPAHHPSDAPERESAPPAPPAPLPPPRAAAPFTPDLHPRRDERFHGRYSTNFPPHLVYNAESVPVDERNLALLCKRTLEMDVPEMMASVMVERRDLPWEFHRDYARQLWDECRHAMMGSVAFEARGVDWTGIPLNVTFALRLNLHASALERQMMLYAIEQSLMPGDTGKRFEYETARAAGDALSAHFHDYDWADEVLHAHIGRRWLRHEGIGSREAVERAREVHERTWAALRGYAHLDEPRDWWDDFVRALLGRPSAAPPELLGEAPKVIAE
ncbi:MAG TPA: hypothetical protein VFS05_09040 [Gemmatimonadaceae bacterium]|nr:hypothetical protein [Gemmatimonadaceae bacterium]